MAKRVSKSLMRDTKVRAQHAGTPTPARAARGSKSISAERAPPLQRRSVPATQAKNRFGEILLAVRDSGPVFIERHGQAQAVVLDIDTYNKLTANERTAQERELDYWTREFNQLHAGMQTQNARHAVDELFTATDNVLNRKRS